GAELALLHEAAQDGVQPAEEVLVWVAGRRRHGNHPIHQLQVAVFIDEVVELLDGDRLVETEPTTGLEGRQRSATRVSRVNVDSLLDRHGVPPPADYGTARRWFASA